MITFADIQKANESLHYLPVKGKNYAEVPQRVKAFRMLYPQGYILTELVSNDGGVCVIKATAGYYGEDGNPYTLGTGIAYEREGSSYINKTSYIENCETSAVGRALGFLGIGSDSSISSVEEVANAILNQQKQQKQPEDAMQPGEKLKPEWNVRTEREKFCKIEKITGAAFESIRRTLVQRGVLEDRKLDELTPVDFDTVCKAVKDAIPEYRSFLESRATA